MLNTSCSRRSFLGLAGGLAAFAGLGLAGCGQAPAAGSAAGSGDAAAALSGTINCGGATSFQPLIEAVAEEFYKENPDVVIAISGGGSGDGISGIVDGVKGLLGISSPSKVFADMGENMALGLGEGFAGEMRGVQRQSLTTI